MALSFAVSVVDYVDHGSATNLDDMDPVTMMAWIIADDESAEFHALMGKNKDAGGQGLSWAIHEENVLAIVTRQTGGVENLEAEATTSNFASFGLGKWMFVAAVVDVGTSARMLVGDLTTAPAEPSSYDAVEVGDGAISTDAGEPFTVGHSIDFGTASAGFAGDVAFVHVVEAALTNGQIIQQWMRPHPIANSRIFSHYYGTGTQADWSGQGNNGTLSGSPTAVDHAPIMTGFGLGQLDPYVVAAGPAPTTTIIPRIMHHRKLLRAS